MTIVDFFTVHQFPVWFLELVFVLAIIRVTFVFGGE